MSEALPAPSISPPPQSLWSTVTQRLARLVRTLKRNHQAAEQDLARISAAPRLFYETELLKSAIGRIKPYDTHVSVMDYGETPPRPLEIALRPGMAAHTQVERRFHEAKRLMAAEEKVLRRLAQLEAALHEAETLQQTLPALQSAEPHTLRALLSTLSAPLRQRLSDESAAKRPGRGDPFVRLPYRIYSASSGRAIWVGKGARGNDLMTFKHASAHAAWLHVSGYQGAHVVVPQRRGEVLDEVTWREAALLAAHFSKAPGEVAVEVTATHVKFLRKAKRAAAGSVIVSREKHIRIFNDAAAAKQLIHSALPEP